MSELPIPDDIGCDCPACEVARLRQYNTELARECEMRGEVIKAKNQIIQDLYNERGKPAQ